MAKEEKWNLIGHEWAVDMLSNHIANDRLRHAYLFTGPEGIGRRTLAIRLAQSINCLQPPTPGFPCYQCRSCKLLNEMQHPDLTVIQADQVGGILKVDQIRELLHTLSLTPFEAQYRIALILRFEEANASAANALLKTLEEPESPVVLLLTAQDSESLLPTIVSRCEVIRLRPLAMEETSTGLQEHYGVDNSKADLLAHISEGRPGFALRMQMDPELMENRSRSLEDLVQILSEDDFKRFEYADNLANDKDSLNFLLLVWSSFWRDIYLKLSGSSTKITNTDWEDKIIAISERISFTTAVEMVNLIQKTNYLLKRNVNPRLTLEVLMLDIPHIHVPSPI